MAIIMPYVVPTASDLVARFPAFAAVPEATITGAIAEAQNRVDQTWLPQDFGIALMLLAAHTMTLDGLGTGAESAAAAAGALGFQSMRSGSLSLDRRSSPTSRPDTSLLNETTYGRRFLALLRVNQPPVVAV